MTVEYRTLRPREEDAAVALWDRVFADDPGDRLGLFRDFGSSPDPDRFERTQVAVDPAGDLLSIVTYWLRQLRDARDVPRRVGHVWGVATRPDARSQGHAGRLLDRAIEAMRNERCDWSILFAQEAAKSLYARHGWRVFPTAYQQGVAASPSVEQPAAYVVRRFDPGSEPGGWAPLAAIYDAFNAARPLTMLRTSAYWHDHIAGRLATWEPKPIIFVTARCPSREPCGYVVSHAYEWGVFVSELGVLPDHPAAVSALLDAATEESLRRGLRGFQACLPREPAIEEGLARLCGGSVEVGYDATLMARPVAPDVADGELVAIIAAPGAISWILDQW